MNYIDLILNNTKKEISNLEKKYKKKLIDEKIKYKNLLNSKDRMIEYSQIKLENQINKSHWQIHWKIQ